jgi:cbb3-type cytochrome oxidase subunit 3
MALAALLFVFFIVAVAIVLFAFPPNKIVEWMSKPKDK